MARKALAAATAAAAGVTAQEPRPRPHQGIKAKRGDAAIESFVITNPEGNEPDHKRCPAAGSIPGYFADLRLHKNYCEKRDRQHEPVQMALHLFYKQGQTSDSRLRFVGQGSSGPATPPAQAADGVTAEEPWPRPPQVILRIIRKTGDVAFENLVVAAAEEDKPNPKRRPTVGSISEHLAELGLNDNCGEKGVSGVRRGVKQATGETSTRAPLLNHLERQLDEAIFSASWTGALSTLRDILSSSPAFVNYHRRIGDSTTALMAAAFHDDMDAVRYFLSLGAETSLAETWGKTAALLAKMRGHQECSSGLQRVADEESARGKEL